MDNSTNAMPVGFFAQEEDGWTDAFNPPPPSLANTKKAWERQPVPAHAPRLQGQKIWKRTGLRSGQSLRDNNDKENVDATQLELEKGGEGARKRVRTSVFTDSNMGGDMLWAEEKKFTMVDGVVSPRKLEEESVGTVRPRKRTNANHLVTPKRGVKRMPLQSLGSDLKGGLSAQMLRFSPKKIALDKDVDGEEKAARRRKSMRKSGIRRLTRNSLEEEDTSPKEITMDPGTGSDSVILEKEVGQEALVGDLAEEIYTSSAEVEQNPQTGSGELPSSSQSDMKDPELVIEEATIPSPQSTEEIEPVLDPTMSTQAATASEEPTLDDMSLTLLNSNDEQSTEAASVEDHMNTMATELELSISLPESTPDSQQAVVVTESVLITTTAAFQPVTEDDTIHIQPNSPILESNFVALDGDHTISNPITSPSKMPSTPRRGKKQTAQPQSTRRSTRSKPASTLAAGITPNEAQPAELFHNTVKAVVEEEQPVVEGCVTADLSELTPSPERSVSLPTTEAQIFGEEIEASAISAELETDFESATNDDLEETYRPFPSFSRISDHQMEELKETVKVRVNEAESPSEKSSSGKIEDDTTDSLDITIMDSNSSNYREDSEDADPEENNSVSSSSESLSTEETITQDFEATVLESDTLLEIPLSEVDDDSMLLSNQLMESMNDVRSDDASEEDLEEFEPVSFDTITETILDNTAMELDTLPGSSTPDPSTTALVETISENAPSTTYNEDDTDLLRKFLTRVKANKEAKAQSTSGKRKRSLPHSPIRLPLESELSSPPFKIDFDVRVPEPSPAKKRKRGESSITKDDTSEPQSIRRSGRTRLPVMTSSLPAPSFIPMRRLGQDGDNIITLRKSEDKELAAVTKINTRKNKGALSALDLLSKVGTQKEDPASRHQALKLKFDEKSRTSKSKSKSKKKKTVVWAEEIAQFQSLDEKELEAQILEIAVVAPSKEKVKEKKKEIAISVATTPVKVVKQKKIISVAVTEVKEKRSIPVRSTSAASMTATTGADEKKPPIKVGVRSSRISMGMVANGTPAPKRKGRAGARS